MKKIWFYLVVVVCTFAFGLSAKPASAASSFSDVSDDFRAKAEIDYLVQGGIVYGISTTAFAPSQKVTRGQAAAMLGRALGMNGEKRSTTFTDVSSGYFASGYIQQMVNRGIISGYPNGQFKPNQTLTRGEMAILISRAFGYGTNSVAVASSQLVKKGIAQGYTDGTFGEKDTIIRADFSVFLARSIDAQFRTASMDSFDRIMYVNVNDLNFRTGPNTNYPSSGKFQFGQVVEYGYSIGDWSYVRANGQMGFVHNAYIQLEVPDPSQLEPKPEPPSTDVPKKLEDLVVIIDPGHGAHDPGAAGYGLVEKNVVLDVGKRMAKYFDKLPIQAKLTRSTDVFLELGERTDFAKKNNGDIFLSIHANAFNATTNGTETYYYKKASYTNPYVTESKALATYVQNRMLEAWGLRNRGVQYKSLYVTRENTMPAALAEMGFIDQKSDNAYLASTTRREELAKALAVAMLDYYYWFEGRQDVLPLYETLGAKPTKKLH